MAAYHISPTMQGPGQQLGAVRRGPALPSLWTLMAEDWKLPRTAGWRHCLRAMLSRCREGPIVARTVRVVVVASLEPGQQTKEEPH